MAEQVQAILDGMVAPLRDLEERGVFSQDEIHAIVDRRRESEYALRRRQARKADFIEYIQHEINLDKLREIRMKRIRRNQPRSENHKGSKSIGDKHVRSHINLIWTRTLRKFRSDLSLYMIYADYLDEIKSFHKLSQLFAQALQIFPREQGLWIRAASHEFFHAGNIQSARVLLQRGLRINQTAADLWLQSFVLELHVLQKLKARHSILVGKQAREEVEEEEDTDEDLALAKLVYDFAIQKIPSDVSFRLRFIEQCNLFPNTDSLVHHIIESVAKDCPDQAEAWIAQATVARSRMDFENDSTPPAKKSRKTIVEISDTVLQILQTAVQALPQADMYSQALAFVREYLKYNSKVHQQASQLVKDIFSKATDEEKVSVDVLSEYLNFLGPDETEKAVQVIQSFVDTGNKIPATVWLRWAKFAKTVDAAARILERAIKATRATESEHLVLLLQLMGAKVRLESSTSDLLSIQERILYLSSGFVDLERTDDGPFKMDGTMDACLQCLQHIQQTDGLAGARKAYWPVLFQSGAVKQHVTGDLHGAQRYIDACIGVENVCQDEEDRCRRLSRIYSRAVEVFVDTELASDYRLKSKELTRQRRLRMALPGAAECISGSPVVPTLDVTSADFSLELFKRTFGTFRVVRLQNVQISESCDFSWQDWASIFHGLGTEDKKSWCIENKGDEVSISPSTFLDASEKAEQRRAYCSFLVQKDASALENTLNRLPVTKLECLGDVTYEPALWVFFGRNARCKNNTNQVLTGRTEHTDSVSHDGTWHYQMSGSKVWTLRASSTLIQHLNQHFATSWNKENRMSVTIKQGDVLVINTRLWFHETSIPIQKTPSVSYARDFCFQGADIGGSHNMTNIDGLYATQVIEEGTIIFKESEMPACELHRSSDAFNCEVVELEDGTSAVVSTRAIAAGEFFCVPETDDEEEDSEGEVDDDSEEEEAEE